MRFLPLPLPRRRCRGRLRLLRRQLIRSDENWLDIGGNPLQAVERLLQGGAHHSHFILQLLRSGVISLGLEGQQIVVQVAHALFEFLQVQGESLVRLSG